MKNNTLIQSGIAAVLIILLFVIWNPDHTWMPDMMFVTVMIAILVVFALFAGFVLREKQGDEREGMHRSLAGRAAFFSGTTVLIIGIIAEAFSGHVDIWLLVAIVVMLVAKIATRIYSDIKL